MYPRLKKILGIIVNVEPVTIIDLSNLVFVLSIEGYVNIDYKDWIPINNVGVMSPLLEVDIARLVFHGLLSNTREGVITTALGRARASKEKIPRELIEKGPNSWRILALEYAKKAIVSLKSYSTR